MTTAVFATSHMTCEKVGLIAAFSVESEKECEDVTTAVYATSHTAFPPPATLGGRWSRHSARTAHPAHDLRTATPCRWQVTGMGRIDDDRPQVSPCIP